MAFVGVNRKGGTKFQWSKAKLRNLIGEAAAQALQKAGLLVRRNTQRSMVGGGSRAGRTVPAKPKFRMYGSKDGYPIVGAFHAVPRPDKVSTWAPQAFLRNDIQSDWDNGTRSVVIGPSRMPRLNRLHEFGGSKSYWVLAGQYPRAEIRGHKVPQKMRSGGRNGRAYVGYIVDRPMANAIPIGSRTIRGRGYMKAGLEKSMKGIPEQFRNTIRKGTL